VNSTITNEGPETEYLWHNYYVSCAENSAKVRLLDKVQYKT